MKILGISGSPRRQGNTEILVGEVLSGAQNAGAEIELFSLAGRQIKPCDGCHACRNTGKCHLDDDMQTVYEKLAAADGLVFGTPIYFYGMTAQLKALIDRMIAWRDPEFRLASKVAGVVAVAGDIGIIDALKDLYFFITINHMLAADYVFGYAQDRGEIRQQEPIMKAAWELGHQIVQLASLGFRFPAEFNCRLSSQVTRKYGL